VVLVEVVLGLGVLAVMPFLNGSGREEAGQQADPPASGGIVLAMILLFVAIVVSFVANARIQHGIERKSAAREL
jgi:putative copper resistance protein D/copper transport protein